MFGGPSLAIAEYLVAGLGFREGSKYLDGKGIWGQVCLMAGPAYSYTVIPLMRLAAAVQLSLAQTLSPKLRSLPKLTSNRT